MSFPYWGRTQNLAPNNTPPVVDFGALMSNLVWQFAGFDQITNLSGEVVRPNRTYPISYLIVIILVLLTYMLTVIAGAMVSRNFNIWYNGGLGVLSR